MGLPKTGRGFNCRPCRYIRGARCLAETLAGLETRAPLTSPHGGNVTHSRPIPDRPGGSSDSMRRRSNATQDAPSSATQMAQRDAGGPERSPELPDGFVCTWAVARIASRVQTHRRGVAMALRHLVTRAPPIVCLLPTRPHRFRLVAEPGARPSLLLRATSIRLEPVCCSPE